MFVDITYNPSEKIIAIFGSIFLGFAAEWIAVLSMVWEGFREEEAKDTGYIVHPGGGILICGIVAILGLYMMIMAISSAAKL